MLCIIVPLVEAHLSKMNAPTVSDVFTSCSFHVLS